MKFGSVCSGIEAASVAWHPLGWRAAWLAEIEPFPSAVLAHHYPDGPNLGDMTQLPERIVMGEIEAPDVFCGGTPCQAFSVAGLRKSLDDARGNLSLTFCEIANAIDLSRNHDNLEPCIVFWENVPGVLNTKDNAFGCFLAGLAGEDDALVAPGGKWSNAGYVLGPQRAVAWRILDAQYFGVAQRRRRVFVVASARDGFDPAAVLFEFDGVRRDTAPSREARQTAPTIPSRSTAGGGLGTDFDLDGGVITLAHGQGGAEIGFDRGPTLTCNHEAPIAAYVTHSLRGEGFDASEDGTGRGTPLIAFHADAQVDQMRFDDTTSASLTCSQKAAVAFSAKDFGGDATTELSPTLRAMPHSGSHANGGGQMAVAYSTKLHNTTNNQAGKIYEEYTTSLDRSSPPPALLTPMQVRRLTPKECERLQGFPDDYTLVPNRGKPAADGPRYKALGNSWAVPNVRWIGWRIAAQLFGDLA